MRTRRIVTSCRQSGLRLGRRRRTARLRLDRATAWQRFRRITLPLLRPAIVMVIIMRTMVALTAFAAIFTVTAGGPGTATEILNLYAYRKSFTELSIGYGSALAVALLIVTILISAILFAIRRAK